MAGQMAELRTTAFRNSSLRPPSAASSGGIRITQALLVQDQERRNAENLSESISARAMQREARWSDETHRAVAEWPGWDTRRRCGCSMAATSPSRAGNRRGLRQAGQGGQLPGWDVPGHVSPLGRALVDKRLSAQELDLRPGPVCCGGCAGGPATTGQRRSWPWQLGYLRLSGDTPSGDLPGGTGGPGDGYDAGIDPAWTSPEYTGFGRPRKPKLRPGQRRTMEQRGDELPDEAWREITVAQGSQGPRTYRFSAQRVRATRRRKPGEELWAVWRRNLDGSEPRYYLSNARAQPWRLWPTWVGPGGALKRSSRLRRVTWGWTNTRPAAGQGGITT